MPTTRELLTHGELELLGRMPWSSNATFLVEACLPGDKSADESDNASDNETPSVRGVYKPRRGERPLWDFPSGIYQREVAAYELSEALGWELVPLTVARDDGPLGRGSVQEFVEADFEQHYFTLLDDETHHDSFRRVCVFDLLANNTDRKSGHLLLGHDGHVWAIDNGLSFHAEFKLRTVIWDFGGEPIPDPVLADVQALVDRGLPETLASLLDPFERDALLTRARAVLNERRFPVDETGQRYPWPLV